MKVHLFFIGGTGARIYRAFVHCLASGIFYDTRPNDFEFCTYLVDSDSSNADVQRALQTVSFYQNIHQTVTPTIKDQTNCPLFCMPLHHEYISIPQLDLHPFLFAKERCSDDTRLFLSAMLGDINNDSPELEKEVFTHFAMSSVSLDAFEKKLNPDEDYTIIIGSTFGVTGRSCLLGLASKITEILQKHYSKQMEARIAQIMVGPYFKVKDPAPDWKKVHAPNWENFAVMHSVFVNYCHRVLDERKMEHVSAYNILPVSDNIPLLDYAEKGSKQGHPAHVIELFVASTIVDYIKEQPTIKKEKSFKFEKAGWGWGDLSLNDFPLEMHQLIDRLLCFSIWCRQFGGRFIENSSAFLPFSEDFCLWIQEMGQHDVSFNPIDFAENTLSQSFFWYKPTKKFGVFNTDPLCGRKLDSQYNKALKKMPIPLQSSHTKLSIQYQACVSAWDKFKSACPDMTSILCNSSWSILCNSTWSISQKEPPKFYYFSPRYIEFSLPTCFSRIWLADIAFELLAKEKKYELNREPDFVSSLAYDCLDLLEFLYRYSDHPDLTIRSISLSNVLLELESSYNPDSQQIAKMLFEDSTPLPSGYTESDNFLFVFGGQVIGGTSPFSLVFTSPNCRELLGSHAGFTGENCNYLFDSPVSFERRGKQFQEHIASLMDMISNDSSLYQYILQCNPESELFKNYRRDIIRPACFDQNYTSDSDVNFQKVCVVTDKGGTSFLRRIFGRTSCHKETFQPNCETYNKSEEPVYSSIFAPAEIKRKSHMLVQIYLHLYEETDMVKTLAQESQKDANRRDYIPLQCKLKKGDKVDVLLNIYGETLLMSEKKSIIWQGSFTKCSFDYFVPKDIDVDELSCLALLTVNEVPIGEMRFITRIVESPRELNTEIIAHKYSKVFISYAHKDEEKVKSFHEALDLAHIDNFFDRAYLKTGDIFPQVIQDYINSADLFVLFWSENASKSKYVQKERRQALKRAFPQVKPQQEAKLSIYPMSIEPRAELPSDMKNNYHFGEI